MTGSGCSRAPHLLVLDVGWAVFWLGAGSGALICAWQLDSGVIAGVGAGCWALGAGFFVVALAAARSRVRLMESQEEVVRSGEPVPATVSDKGYVIFHESTRIFTAVTFTFTDAEGLQRWVRRTMVVRAENPVINGQQTQLWYDRNDPGNDARIVVKLAVDSPLR